MKACFTILAFAAATTPSNAQIPDFTPPTPLLGALMKNKTADVRRLLDQGASPNEGRMIGFPPVFFAAMHQNTEMLDAMIAKGADVQARDASGSTLLMWAASSDGANLELVHHVLKLGIDVNARNQAGETALTWAARRGSTPVVEALKKAGAMETEVIRAAAAKSIALLTKSGQDFVRVSGCTSCHHNSLPQMAAAMAKEKGIPVDEKAFQSQADALLAMFGSIREEILKNQDRLPDPTISVSYSLVGLAANDARRNPTTDAMAHVIAQWQNADGSFEAMPVRPPMESSRFTATALSMRALQLYTDGSEDKVRRGMQWLRTARPETNEDSAMQLLGMGWAGAPLAERTVLARRLLAEQRPDGGWAQLPALETDAYATGQALVALNTAGMVPSTDPSFQRGVAFLLRGQFPDGSWLVRTRTFPVQQYKESGFPHGKDQWISASGTSWAAMALCLALPQPRESSLTADAVMAGQIGR